MRSILILLLLGWSLLGCQRAGNLDEAPVLPVSVVGASDETRMAVQKKLTKQGVQIIIMGETQMVSIPAALLFENHSPKMKWKSYALLNDVVCYLQLFRKVSVHVNTYGSCYLSEQRTSALTLARARSVGRYLWTHDVETRMLFTEGLGDDKPIVSVTKCSDASANARIEIVFREAVV